MLRRIGLTAAGVTLALAASACTADPEPAATPTATPTPKPSQTTRMTFGAYGSPAELRAYGKVVDAFNSASQTRHVELVTWPDHDAAMEDVLAGNAPDVFMASQGDLGHLVDSEKVRPIGFQLDERGVDFGDRFSRDALDAFALDNELQCMAYSISPMVIYYNTDIVDFDAMAETGEYRVPPEARERWTMPTFTDAVEYASSQRGVKGIWIDPTIEGLTPFIVSGGGTVFDNDDEPTSLAFSSDESRDALEETLQVLRDPLLTPTKRQLARRTPLELFKNGRLAMIAGYRDLVPELRKTEGLNFDVISMPYLGSAATVGDIHGLCASSDTADINVAADFIAYAVSDAAIETVTTTGYIVPANTHVANDDVFLASQEQPLHSRVFISSIRGMVVPPFLQNRTELDAAVDPLIARLVTGAGVLDLEAATDEIDEMSRTVLSPEPTETPEPTEGPSESPSS